MDGGLHASDLWLSIDMVGVGGRGVDSLATDG